MKCEICKTNNAILLVQFIHSNKEFLCCENCFTVEFSLYERIRVIRLDDRG